MARSRGVAASHDADGVANVGLGREMRTVVTSDDRTRQRIWPGDLAIATIVSERPKTFGELSIDAVLCVCVEI